MGYCSPVSRPKYKAQIDNKGVCHVVEHSNGRTVAKAADITSLEWLVSELNTMNWAVEHLLKGTGPEGPVSPENCC